VSLLPRLLKTFYRTGLPYLPVVREASAGAKGANESDSGGASSGLELIGFLSRELLDRAMADLDRARQSYERIPASLLVRGRIPDELLPALREVGRLPVLNETGEQVAAWEEAEYLRQVARFREAHPGVSQGPAPGRGGRAHFAGGRAGNAAHAGDDSHPTDADEDEEAGEALAPAFAAGRGEEAEAASSETARRLRQPEASSQRWLGEMILSALPWPMFAADLRGGALFYNDAFQEQVLRRDRLKDSIRAAENYFLELTRSLLAQSFERDPDRRRTGPLGAHVRELGLIVHVHNLETGGRIHGYLYIFEHPGEGSVAREFEDRRADGQGLEEIMGDLEALLVHMTLEDEGYNVSHAAEALQIKRSTLQNKIRRLKVHQRFGTRPDGPIRRRRRGTRDEGETPPASAGQAARPGDAAENKPGAKPAKKPGGKSNRKPTGKTSGKQAKTQKKKRPAKKTQKPKKQPARKRTGKQTGKQTQKPAKKPVRKAAGKTAAKSSDKPTAAKKTSAKKKPKG